MGDIQIIIQFLFWCLSVQMRLLKSVQVIVCLHIFTIFSFLAKMLSSLSRNDKNFARNENIRKICKRTITWTDFNLFIKKCLWTIRWLIGLWKNIHLWRHLAVNYVKMQAQDCALLSFSNYTETQSKYPVLH